MNEPMLFIRKILLGISLLIVFSNFLAAQLLYSLPDNHLPRAMVINPAIQWTKSVDAPLHQGMPYQLSFDRFLNGPPIYIWSSYYDGGENLYTTNYHFGRRSRSHLISPGKGVYYQPSFLLTDENSGWVIWQRKRENNWEIIGRHLNEGDWGPVKLISSDGQPAFFPSITAFNNGIAVAWEDHSTNTQQIKVRIWNGSGWGSIETISQLEKPSYRPGMATTPDGGLWVVWDAYEGLNYSVYGRQIRPEPGRIEKISEPGIPERSNLKPTILYSNKTGLICAWISVIDIRGGKGVLDKWNTIRVASRKNNEWQSVSWEGTYDIADLRHGMLCSIEPPGPVWGYSGQRRHPMLIESDGEVYLLWERKIEHAGSASTPGELCGRMFDGKTWSEPLLLHSGMVTYHVPGSRKTVKDLLTVTAMNTQHQFYSFNISLNSATKLAKTELNGWDTVQLPLHSGSKNRKSIFFGGTTYYLYWGDLHCHTVLSPDAEGEVDEMMHFARDKAGIDVVVMCENDAASWLNNSAQGAFQGENLAESAYRLSVYYSKKYTELNRFIALTGWEWSDRTDDGHPNHRTVIFAGDDTPILRHTENRGNFLELVDAVEAAGGIMNTQHEAFQLIDDPVEANIEVVSGWGNYLYPPDKIYADLSKGFKVGFIATSDGHRQNVGIGGGLTAIYATGLSSDEILDAIRCHRVYATNGNRMLVDARANGIIMGQDLESTGSVELIVQIDAPRPIIRATLIRDGNPIYHIRGNNQNSLEARYTDDPEKGFHWYYWEIQQEGEWPDYPGNMKVAEGHLAWTSPHRVMVQ